MPRSSITKNHKIKRIANLRIDEGGTEIRERRPNAKCRTMAEATVNDRGHDDVSDAENSIK